MIVVDTNVVSEPWRPDPAPQVLRWLRAHADQIHITAVTVHELMFGVARLPEGQRRAALAAGVERVVRRAGGRLLDYDDVAARVHASVRAERAAAGRPIAFEDGMIASIALAHGAAIATRNLRHFEGLGVELVDPWDWSGGDQPGVTARR